MKIILGILTLVVLFTGCAPKANLMAKNMNNASLGMTKQEVIKAMGEPQTVSATHGVEYLNYRLCTREGNFWNDWRCRGWENFYVRLKSGKVDAYGKLGDFDSTKIPESKHTYDVNIKQR